MNIIKHGIFIQFVPKQCRILEFKKKKSTFHKSRFARVLVSHEWSVCAHPR